MGVFLGFGWCGWGGWGWHPGWGARTVIVNNAFINRYNFNTARLGSVRGTSVWAHDGYHRQGVPYPTAGLNSRACGAGIECCASFQLRAQHKTEPLLPAEHRFRNQEHCRRVRVTPLPVLLGHRSMLLRGSRWGVKSLLRRPRPFVTPVRSAALKMETRLVSIPIEDIPVSDRRE